MGELDEKIKSIVESFKIPPSELSEIDKSDNFGEAKERFIDQLKGYVKKWLSDSD